MLEPFDPAPPELDEETLYEECPDCKHKVEGGCLNCFDEGIVPHEHKPIDWLKFYPV